MKKIDLQGKRILYLGPVFFSYDQFLINKLRYLGCIVDPVELELKQGVQYKIINRFKQSQLAPFQERRYNKILIGKTFHYDYVLVRQGYQLSSSIYKDLKAWNPKAQFINFHWDSLKNSYDYRPIMKWFDKVYSFDYKDCENNNNINYLPLFYIDEYAHFENSTSLPEFDLLFIGAWRNMERYQLIKYTDKLCKQNNLKFHYYLYLSLRRQYWALKAGQLPRKAKSRQLTHKQILKLFSKSNTIIDFPSSFQTGLTIRTFEALAAGKKLITSNRNIVKESFYDPEYISVLDNNKFTLDLDFLKSEPKSSIKEKMKEYSLENYVFKLLQK